MGIFLLCFLVWVFINLPLLSVRLRSLLPILELLPFPAVYAGDAFFLTRRNLSVKPEGMHLCKSCAIRNVLLLTKSDTRASLRKGLRAEPLGWLLGQAFGKRGAGSPGGPALQRTTALIRCKDRRACRSFAKSYARWPKANYKYPEGAKPWIEFIMFFSLLKLNHGKVRGNWDVHKVNQNIPINTHH